MILPLEYALLACQLLGQLQFGDIVAHSCSVDVLPLVYAFDNLQLVPNDMERIASYGNLFLSWLL